MVRLGICYHLLLNLLLLCLKLVLHILSEEPPWHTFINVLTIESISHLTEVSMILGHVLAVEHSHLGMFQFELIPLSFNLLDKYSWALSLCFDL